MSVDVTIPRSRRAFSGSGIWRCGRHSGLGPVGSTSQVFAVLRTYRAGTWVAAVVCGTGYFTIYLNRALTSDTYVSYFVVN